VKIVVNTCNTHLHLVPIFCHLFNKYWGKDPVTIIGYDHPNSFSESFSLPDNFDFVQLNGGDQGEVTDFSNHMYDYFSALEDDYFIWVNEDTFLKQPVNFDIVNAFFEACKDPANDKIGRIDFTEGMSHRPFTPWKTVNGVDIVVNGQPVPWRVAIQMSIWNKEYLLKYLKPGRSPWDVEVKALPEAINDGWDILGTDKEVGLAVLKNEGVNRNDIHELNLDGVMFSGQYDLEGNRLVTYDAGGSMDEETLAEVAEIINAY